MRQLAHTEIAMMKSEKPKAKTAALNPLTKSFRAARNASAPLMAVQTPDQAATMAALLKELRAEAVPPGFEPGCAFVWDAVRAIRPLDEISKKQMHKFSEPNMMIRPDEAINAAANMPAESIFFVLNAHRHISASESTTATVQAIWNLRDEFKANRRTLILLAPNIMLPAELETDTLILDEPLPEKDEITAIASAIYEAGAQPVPSEETVASIVAATSGLASFPAEQAIAMSMRKNGIDLDTLWERKRQMVEQTRGLSVYRGKDSYADIGGLQNIKQFTTKVIEGKRKPRVIVFIDEIEKAINPEGDLSGVSKDQLGMLLSFMQDNNATGYILIGPPGTCKSAFAKATGNEAEVPTVSLDMGGMKGGIVGESEGNIRTALKVCKAIGGDRLLFIATCNSIGALPPELRRRFTLGTFFMDLPDAEERAVIWKIYIGKYGLPDKATPADEGWTGAEIRQCCDLAFNLEIPLIEAAGYVVPVAQSAFEKIERLRNEASGRYISAGKPGLYTAPAKAEQVAAPATIKGGRAAVRTND